MLEVSRPKSLKKIKNGALMSIAHQDLSGWFRRPVKRPDAQVRLICFPHAGGAASSFRPWQRLLPAGIEPVSVQYPGREDRFADPFVGSMDDVVHAVVDGLVPLLDRPLALFGHSMGSAIAYEVALELRRRSLPEPVRLLASGRPSPHHAAVGDIHLQKDAAVTAELMRYGSTPVEVLSDPELRATVLRCVRNDYRLIETYKPRQAVDPLDCPISVLVGTEDPECGEVEAKTWGSVTAGSLTITAFDGGHFFLVPQRTRLVETICRELGVVDTTTTSAWPSTP
ncbi:thioesterase II family protein [Streptomyces sp. PTY087I2]|uniref:thioesterase II family protein n=1 Tax=Streptomyces sp. PTY087I2 TaxID=1819298 RepID=UPI0008285B44|nr:alpha/beta fold hydrolase [Streptomyces sp. PTY087I2]OCC14037.1 Linear gramicidin dehydrogenase LgrE [Streptomyces sp. PTY087I2]